jgi:hypothetical protein
MFMFEAVFSLRGPAQRRITTSMQPMFASTLGEQEVDALSAEAIQVSGSLQVNQ